MQPQAHTGSNWSRGISTMIFSLVGSLYRSHWSEQQLLANYCWDTFGRDHTSSTVPPGLQVLSAAALELSQPHRPRLAEVGVASLHPSAPNPLRPWEDEIRERLKAKTRIIARVGHLPLVEEASHVSYSPSLSLHSPGPLPSPSDPHPQPVCSSGWPVLFPPPGGI